MQKYDQRIGRKGTFINKSVKKLRKILLFLLNMYEKQVVKWTVTQNKTAPGLKSILQSFYLSKLVNYISV